MDHHRLVEFLEGANNRLSMSRLTVFLSFFPATYVIMKQQTETMLGLYLGAYVVGYLGGKGADIFVDSKQPQADAVGASGLIPDDSSIDSQPLAAKSRRAGKRKKRAF